MLALILAGAVAVTQPPAPDSPDHHGRTLVINRALGVPCEHCHNPPQSKAAPKSTYLFAQRMMRMVEGLNTGKLKELGGVTCWTCHRGEKSPAKAPAAGWGRGSFTLSTAGPVLPQRGAGPAGPGGAGAPGGARGQ